MSHPDSSHDHGTERADDDLLRDEVDFKRYEEEQELLLQRSLAISAAAEGGIRRDQRSRIYGGNTHDTAPDGRPLFVGTETYEQWIKSDKRENEK